MKNLAKQLRGNSGYTLDQTILIVAIIAILITLIVLTVGWDLITRAGGTKLAAQLRQIEDSAGSFYGANGMWLHQGMQASGTSAGNSVNVRYLAGSLVDPIYFGTTGTWRTDHINYLPGFETSGSGTTNSRIYHTFGSGGQITMGIVNMSGGTGSTSIRSGSYYMVSFAGIPVSEAEKVKEQIDGDFSNDAEIQAGRVTFRAATTTNDAFTCASSGPMNFATFGTASSVNVCYVANLVN